MTSRVIFRIIIFFLFFTFIFLLFKLYQEKEGQKKFITETVVSLKGEYIGPESCAKCHQKIYDSYLETNHAKTSGFVSLKNFLGPLEEGENIFPLLKGQSLKVLEKDQKVYVQRLTKDGQIQRENSMDLFIGSGKIGRNYYTFKDDQFHRLQIHYLHTISDWTLSPNFGYPAENEQFQILGPRCLSCHMTSYREFHRGTGPNIDLPYWQTLSNWRVKDIITSVSCESCHGPGAAHVALHELDQDKVFSDMIVHPGKLSQEKSLQNCAFCHSGLAEPAKGKKYGTSNLKSFIPGRDLKNYLDYETKDMEQGGPHANNLVPLKKSACFQKSEGKMNCLTCHNVHEHERGDIVAFSKRCLSCHQNVTHKEKELKDISSNCIDCHMPKQDWDNDFITKDGTTKRVQFRSHLIKR